MSTVVVPLGYGYYVSPADGPDRRYVSARFPFAQWFQMSGGPLVEGESPATAKVYRCSECEHEKLGWIAKHSNRKWSIEEKQSYDRALALKNGH